MGRKRGEGQHRSEELLAWSDVWISTLSCPALDDGSSASFALYFSFSSMSSMMIMPDGEVSRFSWPPCGSSATGTAPGPAASPPAPPATQRNSKGCIRSSAASPVSHPLHRCCRAFHRLTVGRWRRAIGRGLVGAFPARWGAVEPPRVWHAAHTQRVVAVALRARRAARVRGSRARHVRQQCPGCCRIKSTIFSGQHRRPHTASDASCQRAIAIRALALNAPWSANLIGPIEGSHGQGLQGFTRALVCRDELLAREHNITRHDRGHDGEHRERSASPRRHAKARERQSSSQSRYPAPGQALPSSSYAEDAQDRIRVQTRDCSVTGTLSEGQRTWKGG